MGWQQLPTMSMRKQAGSNGVIHASPVTLMSQRQWGHPWGAFLLLESWKGRGAISCREMENGMFHLGEVLLTPHSQVWQETCARLGLSYHLSSLQEDSSSHLSAFCLAYPRLAPGSSPFCTLPGVERVRILRMNSSAHWALLLTWSPAQQPHLLHQKLWLD